MKSGTKSILFGAHCFFLHPLAVAFGWWKLYGFRKVPIYATGETASLWRPALWVAFFVHDLGYWGVADMDGEEGEFHPLPAAWLMLILFGRPWYCLVAFHSRYVAKAHNWGPSPLCWADKLAPACTPWWLYVPMCRLTGEIREYTKLDKSMDRGLYDPQADNSFASDLAWYRRLQKQWKELAYAHAPRA